MPSIEETTSFQFSKTRKYPTGEEADDDVSGDPSLTTAFESKVRPYIDLIDELRQIGLDEELELPAVVVIGDQSSGKSSILEAISGIQLPRGSGIVTRCPLEMRLKKSAENTLWTAKASYRGKKNELKETPITTPADTENAIRHIQNEIAGEGKGISHNLISLHVEAPTCPDLTLIDLPGIARTAVDGQPSDIPEQIKALLQEYCRRPETIMLCVIPSNVDVAVNEALTLARSFDPNGVRTLGVLTKPDLVDQGAESDVLEVVDNKKFFLKKGYSIVRCRGQKDINDGINLMDAIRQEKKFFSNHKVYKKVDPALRGTTNLALKLTDNLVTHIRTTIPKLKQDVRQRAREVREQLEALGIGPPTEAADKRLLYIKLAQEYLIELENVIKNRQRIPATIFDLTGDEILTEWVNAAYRWRKFFGELKEYVEEFSSESFKNGDFTIKQIEIKRTFYRGRELPRYVTFDFFEALVQEHLDNYQEPIDRCMDNISADIVTLIQYVSEKCLSQYPKVMNNIQGICEEVHRSCKKEGQFLLRLEMRKEKLVYSQDTTYLKTLHSAMSDPMTFLISDGADDDREGHYNAVIVQELLMVYLDIVNRRMMDNIPMVLRSTQHDMFIESLRSKLNEISSGDQSDELICEDIELEEQRKTLQERHNNLMTAMKMLNSK